MGIEQSRSAVARIIERSVLDKNGCFVFSGAHSQDGYGNIGRNGIVMLTHRIMYEAMAGLIPKGLEIDHLCRNRACCNPAHLEPVTRKENLRRSPIHNANKTHCPKGHIYDEENTYRGTMGNGYPYRACRTCNREKAANRLNKARKAVRKLRGE